MTDIIPLNYNNQVVATYSVLADYLGTDENNLSKNFNRNKDRFVEGKHFFKLSHLDTIKVTESHVLNYQGLKGITVWTERGCSRHSKILQTDEAWELWELMEDTYFDAKKSNTLPATYVDALKQLVTTEEARLVAVRTVEKLNTIVDNEFGYSSIIRAASFLGVHERVFNWRPLRAESELLGLEVKRVPSPRFDYQLLYPIKAFENCYPQYDFIDMKPEKILETIDDSI